jgi:hypothetical protein
MAYWPDTLEQEGNNLKVNPPPEACNTTARVPFMWWGVRLSDPAGRNQLPTGSLAAALPYLKPHLEPLYWEQRRRQRAQDATKSTGGAALDVAIEFASAVSGLGVVKAAGKLGRELINLLDGELARVRYAPIIIARLPGRSLSFCSRSKVSSHAPAGASALSRSNSKHQYLCSRARNARHDEEGGP